MMSSDEICARRALDWARPRMTPDLAGGVETLRWDADALALRGEAGPDAVTVTITPARRRVKILRVWAKGFSVEWSSDLPRDLNLTAP
jgi:hypothetical protein